MRLPSRKSRQLSQGILPEAGKGEYQILGNKNLGKVLVASTQYYPAIFDVKDFLRNPIFFGKGINLRHFCCRECTAGTVSCV